MGQRKLHNVYVRERALISAYVLHTVSNKIPPKRQRREKIGYTIIQSASASAFTPVIVQKNTVCVGVRTVHEKRGERSRQGTQQSLRRAGLINLDSLPSNLNRVIIPSLDLLVDTEFPSRILNTLFP